MKAKNTFKKRGLKFKLVFHNIQYIIDLRHALNFTGCKIAFSDILFLLNLGNHTFLECHP